MKTINNHLHIIIILIMSIIVGIFYYAGFYASDDYGSYMNNIIAMDTGKDLTNIIRTPVIILGYIGYKVLGSNPDAIPYIFTLIYPLVILAVYVLLNIVHSKEAGIIGSIITLGTSVFFYYSGSMLPDNLITVTLLSCYIFVILCFKETDTKKQRLYIMLTGFFSLCLFTLKEPYLLGLIGFFPLGLHYKKDIKKCVTIACKVLIWFILFYLLNKVILYLWGYPLTFLSIDVGDYKQDFIDANIARGTVTFVDHFKYAVKRLLPTIFEQTFFILIMVSMIIGLKENKTIVRSFSLAYVLSFLYFSCSSISFTEFIGLPLQVRYFAPIHGIGIIILSYTLAELVKGKNKKYIILVILLLCMSVIQIQANLFRAGNIYNSIGDRIIKDGIYDLTLNNKFDRVNFSKYTGRYMGYYYNTNGLIVNGTDVDNIKDKPVFTVGNNDDVLLNIGITENFKDYNTLFIYDPRERIEVEKILQDRETGNKKLVIIKGKLPKVNDAVIPFITKTQKKRIKYKELYFAYYIQDTEYKEIININFEPDYENDALLKYRNADLVTINSDGKENYLSIKSDNEYNYVYKKLKYDEIKDYLSLNLSTRIRSQQEQLSKVSFRIDYNDETSERIERKHSENEWEDVNISMDVSGKIKEVTIIISCSSGGFNTLVDDIILTGEVYANE